MIISCLEKLLTTSEIFSLKTPTIRKMLNLELKLLHTGDHRYGISFQKTKEMRHFYRKNLKLTCVHVEFTKHILNIY